MKAIISIIFITISSLLFSQSNNSKWIKYKETKGITISYKYQECIDKKNGLFQELVFFRFENNSDKDVEVSFDFLMNYIKQDEKSSYKSEQHRKIVLKKNTIIESNYKENREFSIFSKFLNYTDKSELNTFDLINLNINPLK